MQWDAVRRRTVTRRLRRMDAGEAQLAVNVRADSMHFDSPLPIQATTMSSPTRTASNTGARAVRRRRRSVRTAGTCYRKCRSTLTLQRLPMRSNTRKRIPRRGRAEIAPAKKIPPRADGFELTGDRNEPVTLAMPGHGFAMLEAHGWRGANGGDHANSALCICRRTIIRCRLRRKRSPEVRKHQCQLPPRRSNYLRLRGRTRRHADMLD